MNKRSAIEVQHLTVVKNGRAVINDVSVSILKGKVTGLIGPSGSGKTTLMRTLVGLQAPLSGEVTIFGLPAGHKILRSSIGYVTQSPAIYFDLTVNQNLLYFARLVGASRQNVDSVIKKVDLDAQRNQLAGDLSGGQKARVSLAVALLGRPKLLVLDEPTVGLDPLLRAQLWDMFAELAREGASVLISSHVMDEAERCDELILLRDGDVLWNGAQEGLLASAGARTAEEAFIKTVRYREDR